MQYKPKALIVGRGRPTEKVQKQIDNLTELGYIVEYQDYLENDKFDGMPISHIWFDEWSKTE